MFIRIRVTSRQEVPLIRIYEWFLPHHGYWDQSDSIPGLDLGVILFVPLIVKIQQIILKNYGLPRHPVEGWQKYLIHAL